MALLYDINGVGVFSNSLVVHEKLMWTGSCPKSMKTTYRLWFSWWIHNLFRLKFDNNLWVRCHISISHATSNLTSMCDMCTSICINQTCSICVRICPLDNAYVFVKNIHGSSTSISILHISLISIPQSIEKYLEHRMGGSRRKGSKESLRAHKRKVVFTHYSSMWHLTLVWCTCNLDLLGRRIALSARQRS